MGVIQRQGIKQSLVNFIGVGIGAISTIFIYPLDKEVYGLVRFLIDTSMFLTAFIAISCSTIAVRFNEEFRKDSPDKHGLLGFLLLIATSGAVVFLLVSWIGQEQIFQFFSDKSPLFHQFLPYLIPIAILMSYFNVFTAYSVTNHRIVVPAIVQNFVKITLPVLFLLVIKEVINLQTLVNGLVLNYVFVFFALVFYLFHLKSFDWKIDFSFLNKERLGRIGNFALFGFLAQLGSLLALKIDGIMVPTLIDFKSNGVYAIAAFIGNAIMIPGLALMQISSPIIAKALKEDRIDEVANIYTKASLNLTFVGLFFLVAVVASVEDLFQIMPKSEELTDGFMIVLLIGIAKVFDLMTSVNNQIIAYSKHYRFGMYAVLFMGGLNILFNLILIPNMGIVGAALATLISLAIYNFMKFIFIYRKFGIQPFSMKILVLIALAAMSYLISIQYTSGDKPILDIIIRSIIVIAIYFPILIYFRVSQDINDLLLQGVNRIKSFIRLK